MKKVIRNIKIFPLLPWGTEMPNVWFALTAPSQLSAALNFQVKIISYYAFWKCFLKFPFLWAYSIIFTKLDFLKLQQFFLCNIEQACSS